MKPITFLCLIAGLLVSSSDLALAQGRYSKHSLVQGRYSNYSQPQVPYRPPLESNWQLGIGGGIGGGYGSDYYQPRHPSQDLNAPIRLTRPEDVEAAIRGYYLEYLGREPEPSAMATWVNHVYNVASLREARVGILSSPEYFNRSRNNPTIFVQSLFRDIAGRRPQGHELNQWLGIYHDVYRGDRAEFVREFLASMGQ